MTIKFRRLVDTLRLIPTTGRIATSDVHRRLLALGHTASKRTVERDLQELALTYPLACDDRERPFGWYWLRPELAPVLPAFGVPEAMGLVLLERELGSVMPSAALEALAPWLKEALRTLREAGPSRAQRWIKKIAIHSSESPLRPAVVARATQDAVNEALFTERQLECEYRRAFSDAYAPIRVHPLGLVRGGLVSYLVVCFDGYDDPRLIALHRMRKVRLLDAPVTTPSGFDLAGFLDAGAMLFGTGAQTTLRLRMNRNSAAHLRDTPLSDDQQIEDDPDNPDKVLVTATVKASQRLDWWIAGFGDAAERLPSSADSDL